MVQRKPVAKPGIQAEAKNCIKPEKKLKTSSQYQDARNKGSDLARKMKKARSFKLSNSESMNGRKERFGKLSIEVPAAASPQKKPSPRKLSDASPPNYMKPTTSSDARKERVQVTPKPQIQDKIRSPKGSSSSKSPVSGQKSIKILRKNSSLKPIRSSMKKSSGFGLYPKMNVGRATCSSTLKDSKFPAYVELSPGSTEGEGTSVMKVCPYTYCSLNGHHHRPLPPLKRFLSAKRRLLRNLSMKLKGVSTPKAKNPRKKEIDSRDEMDFMIADEDFVGPAAPLIEEVRADFFIQIYAKPKEELKESGEESKFGPSPEDPEEIMVLGDDEIVYGFSEFSEMEEDSRNDRGKVEEAIPSTISGDNLGQGDFSDYSMGPYENDREGIEYVDSHDTKKAEIDLKFSSESIMDGEMLIDESDSETISMDRQSDPSESFDEESVLKIVPFAENEDYEICNGLGILENSNGTEKVSENRMDVLSTELAMVDSEEDSDADLDEGDLGSGVTASSICGDEACPEEAAEKAEELEAEGNGETEPAMRLLDLANEVTDTAVESRDKAETVKSAEDPDKDDRVDSIPETFQGFAAEDQVSQVENIPETEQGTGAKMVLHANEEESFLPLNDQLPESKGFAEEFKETREQNSEEIAMKCEDQGSVAMTQDQNTTVADQLAAFIPGIGSKQESTEPENDQVVLKAVSMPSSSPTEEDENPTRPHRNPPENCTAVDGDGQSLLSPGLKMKQFYNRRTRLTTEDPDPLKKFNPRPPRFLPLEHDPEAEKVDLRHQMMDERKNSEEWMLDYALRQTVCKLGPARKRRVALLVEAFETVMPVPKYEIHIPSPAATFSHIRPIQACS